MNTVQPNKFFDQAAMLIDEVQAEFNKHVIMDADDRAALLGTAVLNRSTLIEGDPGTGKTHGAKVLAQMIQGTFARIQGSPDLLPSDIIGNNYLDPRDNSYQFRKGPVFSNVVLLDELNRSQPRSQTALLEAMGEGQVTVNGITMPTGNIVVVATQNPNEIAQGTYPLNVAQKDRFVSGIELPGFSAETMVQVHSLSGEPVRAVATVEQFVVAGKATREFVVVPNELVVDAAKMVVAVRNDRDVESSSSALSGARAHASILELAQAHALLDNRRNVKREDIVFGALYALPHRVGLTIDADMSGGTAQQVVNRHI